jgi:hypothetical protein
MTPKEIAHLRLLNQSIAHPHFADPADVVKSLGAMQAQDYGQALWAIGLRTKGARVGDVVESIQSGKILRTWPMRGTIHFIPAEDAKWMLSLVSERMLKSAVARRVGLDMQDDDFLKAEEIVRSALKGGKRLSRSALVTLLEGGGINMSEQRSYLVLWVLSLMGLICMGPLDGKQQMYVLLDEWVPNVRELSREEGLGELARRYFRGHGPATLVDFATWSSQPKRDAALGLELAKDQLTSVTVDGVEYWMHRDQPTMDRKAVADTYLLAGFEEYLLGYKDRSAVLIPGAKPATANGIFFPIVVVDGRVQGVWRRVTNRKHIAVSFKQFAPFSPEVMQEARRKAEAYGEFMGLPIAFDE